MSEQPSVPEQPPTTPVPSPPAPAPGYPPAYQAGYPAQQPGYPPSGYQQPAHQQPGYQATPQTSSNAVVALVLAILSWVLCPVVLAVVALVVAGSAQREIAQSQGWKTGEGMVTAARVVAWAQLVLMALGAVFVLAVLVGAAVSGGSG